MDEQHPPSILRQFFPQMMKTLAGELSSHLAAELHKALPYIAQNPTP